MSDELFFDDKGFKGLEKLLKDYSEKMEQDAILDVLEIGAKELVSEVIKLPKPRSEINKAGYTHLIDTVTYQRNQKDVSIGWGKYYGPFIENGTSRRNYADEQAHINPTFQKNKEKIYKTMLKKLYEQE